MRNHITSILFISLIFFSCSSPTEQTTESVEPQINFMEFGKEISAIAQAELMKNVKSALSKGGPAHAIEHCNIHANPISDSIANEFDVSINRISLKYRNPENAPTSKEDKILLNDYLERLNEGGVIKDTLVKNNGLVNYYRPIIISAEACLKCHGLVGDEINNETMIALNKLYPEDRATNYRMGEFRGTWKISFSQKSN